MISNHEQGMPLSARHLRISRNCPIGTCWLIYYAERKSRKKTWRREMPRICFPMLLRSASQRRQQTLLGGQLRVRDLVDLVAVPTRDPAGAKKFENLMVLNIIQANKVTNLPAAIVLAVPRVKRDDFASAVVGAELLVTRKIVAIKP